MVALTKGQLVQVNRAINGYIHFKRAYELSRKELSAADSISQYYRKCLTTQQGITALQEVKLTEQTTFFEGHMKKQKRKSRITSIGVGVGGVLFGIVLGVLLCR